MASVQLGVLLHGGNLSALLTELLQKNFANRGMGHFAATEPDSHLDTVAFLQELLRVLQLHIEVIGIDVGRHTDLLDLDHMLVLAGFLLTLTLLKLVLALVHQLADGGICLRGDLHQIQTLLIGDLQSFVRGHDAQLLTVAADQAQFLVTNFLIQLMRYIANTEAPPQQIAQNTCLQNKNANATQHPHSTIRPCWDVSIPF